MNEPKCLRLPLDSYPGMNPFVLDWLAGKENATRFLDRRGGLQPPAGGRRPPLHAPLPNALIDSNRRWGLSVESQVKSWASGQAITLVAGQQVGFAGGPLYTLAKLATLVKMKRELERSGRPVTAFFWLATEDHDFGEIAQLSVPVTLIERDVNRQLDLVYIRPARAVQSHVVAGRTPVPEVLVAELLALLDIPRPSWLREGISFGDSFAELVASVFGSEIVLIDSLLLELRRAGAPLFDGIQNNWDQVQRALQDRSHELKSAGYGPQIEHRQADRYTLLFEIDEGGTRHVLDGPRNVPPEKLSTSALTRPLLQDFVLRPDVFVGGPAEVAYYAQIAPLHQILHVSMPRVALRGHLLVAPKRVLRFVSRFDITPEEVFTSPDSLLAEREPDGVAEVKREASEAQKELMRRIEKIADIALPAEHALARAINRSVGHLEYHFNKLTERAIKGLVRKNKERYAAVRELIATLYPDRQVQDRIAGWFPFWWRYQQHLIDRFIEEIEPDAASFKIIGL